MLALTKGKYLGAVSRNVAANGVLIGMTEYQAGHDFSPMHYHENPHLSLVLKGTMSVRRKGFGETVQAVESCSFMRAGEVHQNFLHSAYGRNMNLELEPEFFRTYDINESQVTPQLVKDHPESTLLMLRLYKELMIGDDSLSDQVHIMLLSLADDWQHSSRSQAPHWVGQVRELLHDNWNKTVTLLDMAQAANVHPVTVSRYFTRYFGTGFGAYRRKLKVERAAAMISSSGRSLTEVSFACGFYDQSHFIRAFKSLTHMLPYELRSV
ncbi:AraC family transcriptional regulator [Mucilaginibacter pineti]|uniref:AraC family transcriptional regulator n=1 Tax=Mucilaginibacter pineti TaxID=1391627 RepID=A0A1G7ELP6_9SPHI|nr:AraC family transcriptional regulator [Mucilaginibacter pineti]SDE64532.1 AraC family transcriptional regulator [Mucilaginibacter pineti]